MSLAKVNPATVSLREDVHRGRAALRVDRDKGIIYRVKVLGLVSDNGRRYLPEATRAALPLYEGRAVRIDHPDQPDRARASASVFGKLLAVQADDQGELWGDLHYLKSHPMAAQICEAAERMPDLFGLSHNADGEGETDRDGTFVVHRITEVRSVDVVADPATTRGLAEQRMSPTPPVKPKRVKLRAFLEGQAGKLADQAKRGRLRKLLEMGDAGLYGATEMDEPAAPEGGGDPDEQLWQGFRAAILAVIDGDGSADEKVKKIKAYLKSHEKVTKGKGEGGGEAGDGEEEIEEGAACADGRDDDEKKRKMEHRRLVRKDRARDLCEQANLSLGGEDGRALLESLVRCPDDAAMSKLIEREKRLGRAGSTGGAPRTQAPGTGRPLSEERQAGGGGGAYDKIEDVASLLTGGPAL